MALHNITFNLTTEQVIHLNDALNEHYSCNMDAMSSICFAEEAPTLQKQCEALQTLMDSISEIVSEVEDAK